MTTAEILHSRRILRQAERAYVAERVSTFALRVACYFRELEIAAVNRRNATRQPSRGRSVIRRVESTLALHALEFAAMDRRSLNLASRLPK